MIINVRFSRSLVFALVFIWAPVLTAEDESVELNSITESLIEVASDPDTRVRLAAFTALRELPPSESLARAFRLGINDSDREIRRTALLGLIRSEKPTDEFVSLLISLMSDRDMQDISLGHLAKIGDSAVPLVVAELEKESKNRVAIVGLLGNMQVIQQRAKVVTTLTSLLKDSDPEVRVGAVNALSKFAKSNGAIVLSVNQRYAMEYLKRYDRNSDGALTKDEWSQMSRDPKAADSDNDGRITVDEFAKWLVSRQRDSPR